MTDGASKVHITNIDEFRGHECLLQETVTELRIEFRGLSGEMISISSSIQELNARMETWMKGQDEKFALLRNHCSKSDIIALMQAKLELLEDRVERAEIHKCKHDENITNILKNIESLKATESQRIGSKIWEDRFVAIGQAVFIALFIAVAMFFMKGGSIT